MLLTECQNKMINEAVDILEQLDSIIDTQDINDPAIQPEFHKLMSQYGQLVESIERTGNYAMGVLNERISG